MPDTPGFRTSTARQRAAHLDGWQPPRKWL